MSPIDSAENILTHSDRMITLLHGRLKEFQTEKIKLVKSFIHEKEIGKHNHIIIFKNDTPAQTVECEKE